MNSISAAVWASEMYLEETINVSSFDRSLQSADFATFGEVLFWFTGCVAELALRQLLAFVGSQSLSHLVELASAGVDRSVTEQSDDSLSVIAEPGRDVLNGSAVSRHRLRRSTFEQEV